MSMSYTSSSPVTISQGSSNQTYGTWTVGSHYMRINADGSISLDVTFILTGVDGNGNAVKMPGSGNILHIDNILVDSSVNAQAAALFQAILSKAVSTGVIA